MKAPKVRISLILTVFAFIHIQADATETITQELQVTGLANAPDGRFFAVTRIHGVIKQGDILNLSTETESFKVKIVSINSEGVQLHKFDTVKLTPAVPPKPGKATYQYRDPFWPIGYEPRTGDFALPELKD